MFCNNHISHFYDASLSFFGAGNLPQEVKMFYVTFYARLATFAALEHFWDP